MRLLPWVLSLQLGFGGFATAAMATEPHAAQRSTGNTEGAEAARLEAEQAYAEGEGLYHRGEYARAALAFERALDLSQVPELWFDIGQAHRLAGPSHCAEAKRAYESYLANVADSAERAPAEQRLRELGSCQPTSPAALLSAASPPSQPVAPHTRDVEEAAPHDTSTGRSQALPIGLMAGGVGAALAGGALLWASHDKYREAKAACPCPEGTYDTWERWTYVSYGLLGIGLTAASVGVVLWRNEDRAATVRLAPSRVEVAGTF